ncbi:hypothetical protein WA026_013178 [Henosepilachna vigintioctopunctata]|uniref:Nucleoside diphosphate kinase-like domain-containing protein n=1 Tax=Henosepilachna vigintioctopunctata TaxID=420089 RepID=A0AAW1UDW5_9CUCU
MHQGTDTAVGKEGPSCKNKPLKEDYDPRSYCHSIISHPEKVCEENDCSKSKKKANRKPSEGVRCTPYATCKTERFSDEQIYSNMEDIRKFVETQKDDRAEKIPYQKDDKTTKIIYEYSKYPKNTKTISKETLLSGIKGDTSEDDVSQHNAEIKKQMNILYTQKASPKKSNAERVQELNQGENNPQYAEETAKDPDNTTIKKNSSKIIEKVFDKRQNEKTGSSAPHRTNLRKIPLKKYDENTVKLLRELTKTLGSEGVTAISHLVKAEICSCCKCMICKCKTKGKGPVVSMGPHANDQEAPRDYQKEILGMEMAYSWAFDYFDTPDLENYEKQRQERFELERQLAEEEEVSLLIEEILKEEGVKGDKQLSDVQTKQILEKMKEIVSLGTMPDTKSETSPNVDTKKKVTEEEIIKYKEKINQLEKTPGKQNELEHTKQQNPTTTERRPQSKESGVKDVRSTDMKRISTTPSLKEVPGNRGTVTPSARPPPRYSLLSDNRKTKRQKKLQKNIIELRHQKKKRMSYKESVSLSQESNQWNSAPVNATEMTIKEKADIPDSEDRDLLAKHILNESDNEIVEKPTINYDEETLTKPESVVKLSSKLILALTRASESAKKRVEARRFTLHPSLRHYTDICNCLPGACQCGSHYLFRNIKPTTPVDMNENDLPGVPSCLCFHSTEEVEEEEEEIIVHDLSFSQFFRTELPRSDYILCPKQPKYEKTVIIIKPEATMYKDVVLRAIKKEGLDIIDQRIVQLTPEQVTEIYDENHGSAYFFMFIKQMSSTPIWVFAVAGISAIERWKKVIGEDETIHSSWFYPESIKRRFGLHTDIYGAMKTSADAKGVRRDLQYFFPLDILEPISIASVEVQDYCDNYINPTLLKGLYMVAQEKPEDPILYLAEWVLRNNPNTPSFTNPQVALAPT